MNQAGYSYFPASSTAADYWLESASFCPSLPYIRSAFTFLQKRVPKVTSFQYQVLTLLCYPFSIYRIKATWLLNQNLPIHLSLRVNSSTNGWKTKFHRNFQYIYAEFFILRKSCKMCLPLIQLHYSGILFSIEFVKKHLVEFGLSLMDEFTHR